MATIHSLRVGTLRSVRGAASSHNPLLLSSSTIAPQLQTPSVHSRRTIVYLPIILQPSFWRSLVPTFLRRRDPDAIPIRRRPWNPATYFIWMFLLIGSQAIQMITLRSGFDKFSQETETKLQLLRDVVKRIQAGEKVDVKKELGTGDQTKEREWRAVMEELAKEDTEFQTKRRQKKEKEAGSGQKQ